MAGYRLTGATMYLRYFLSYLASTYAGLNEFKDASRCIDEAMTMMKGSNENVVKPTSTELSVKS
jgi:hypothetical protein